MPKGRELEEELIYASYKEFPPPTDNYDKVVVVPIPTRPKLSTFSCPKQFCEKMPKRIRLVMIIFFIVVCC